ncbi:hypothetical protein [Kitasatospora mediocidica]|uniref:hypothetical protein n=1 Tax=Kitasatospora mediocidica TaxID=58352 RepID=UPI00055A70D3|nr:hypothetical protein [Kitasatospora mediocidica]
MPRTTHPLRATAGPLTAALSLSREFPHLPATSVEARGSGLLILLFGADAAHYREWVDELRLTEEPVSWHPHRDRMAEKRVAVGLYAEVELRVMAYPDAVVGVAS